MTTRSVQAGAAMPVHVVNPEDIGGGGSGSGQATATKQDQQTTLLTTIAGYVDGLETLLTAISSYVDGLEALVGVTNTNTNTTNGKLDTVNAALSSIAGYVDGIESLVGTTNSNTNTTNGKLDTLSSILTSIAGYVDGLETLIGSTNSAITTTNGKIDTTNSTLSSIAGYTDGIETLLTAISGYVDGLEGQLTALIALYPSSLGQKTKSGSISVTLASDSDALPAGENVIGATVGKSSNVTVNPTVSTSPAYTAGDSIGGKFTLTGALRVSGGSGYLQSIMILDRANQKPAGTILIYNADPTNATLTDNSALSNSTDDQKIIASIPVAASDYTTISSKAYANLSSLGRGVKAASGTTLYASFVTTSTPTFAATTDLQLVFSFLLD